ncbi:uncharacterized protein [Venturia canescens]|uniref:uncharacterized protein n=1 Tax=Venturia canescens TaxID=32260 RepID=UPI001C9C7215|nr:uncharacterized protein LOC122415752 [Venturia canescens]
MYKTVRQGEARLQYTILPQIDQFYVNEMSFVRSSGAAARPRNRAVKAKYRNGVWSPFDFPSALIGYLGFRVIAFLFCFGIGIYLIEQMVGNVCDGNHCRATFSMTKEIIVSDNNVAQDYEIKNELADSLVPSDQANSPKTWHHYPKAANSIEPSSLDPSTEGAKMNHSGATIGDFPIPQEARRKAYSSRLQGESTTSTPMDVASVSSKESSASRSNGTGAAPSKSAAVNVLRKWKMKKMPRVALKMRRNETSPRVYVGSGIASYKKGNITTSLVAQQLSLEGVIFRGPENTKPWHENWPFKDNAAVFQRLKHGIMRKKLTMLAMLLFSTASLVSMAFFVLTVTKRQWHLVEEIDVEIQDDSSSNLLSIHYQYPIDKE